MKGEKLAIIAFALWRQRCVVNPIEEQEQTLFSNEDKEKVVRQTLTVMLGLDKWPSMRINFFRTESGL